MMSPTLPRSWRSLPPCQVTVPRPGGYLATIEASLMHEVPCGTVARVKSLCTRGKRYENEAVQKKTLCIHHLSAGQGMFRQQPLDEQAAVKRTRQDASKILCLRHSTCLASSHQSIAIVGWESNMVSSRRHQCVRPGLRIQKMSTSYSCDSGYHMAQIRHQSIPGWRPVAPVPSSTTGSHTSAVTQHQRHAKKAPWWLA